MGAPTLGHSRREDGLHAQDLLRRTRYFGDALIAPRHGDDTVLHRAGQSPYNELDAVRAHCVIMIPLFLHRQLHSARVFQF